VAQCEPEYRTGICHIGADGNASYFSLPSSDFAALFEKIPRAKMVTISLPTAHVARDHLERAGIKLSVLDAAIEAAVQEDET
jgi:hypothetical protein